MQVVWVMPSYRRTARKQPRGLGTKSLADLLQIMGGFLQPKVRFRLRQGTCLCHCSMLSVELFAVRDASTDTGFRAISAMGQA